jgi:pimeloyl-ACP methyl ester carboxylesterase
MLRLRASVLAIVLLMATGQTPAPSFPFDQGPYSHPQQLVDVGGGRKMNLYCVGSGSPTIILESGFGSAMWTWGYVQGTLAKLTRTCAYDRAGYGFSDPGPMPRTASTIATDLHELLAHANIPPPYVLVGHSLGGYHVRLFADEYPNTVLGLVLLDPATTATTPILDSMKSVSDADKADTERRQMCLRLSQEGQFDSPSWTRCVENDPRYTPEMNEGRQFTKRRPGYWMTVNSEYVSGPIDESILNAIPVGFGDKPLIVLTAANGFSAADLDTSTDKALELQQTRWRAHKKMAGESSLGIGCVVQNTSHFVQIDQPTAVISAIQSILNTGGSAIPTCPVPAGASPK